MGAFAIRSFVYLQLVFLLALAELCLAQADGEIVRVEFFVGERRVHTATQEPFEYGYEGLEPGRRLLRARAFDGGGKRGTADVLIDVKEQ